MLTSSNVILQGVKKEGQRRSRGIFHEDICQDQLAVKPVDIPRHANLHVLGNLTEEGLQSSAAAK